MSYVKRELLQIWVWLHGHAIVSDYIKAGISPNHSRLYGNWNYDDRRYFPFMKNEWRSVDYFKFKQSFIHNNEFWLICEMGDDVDLFTYKIPIDQIYDYKKYLMFRILSK